MPQEIAEHPPVQAPFTPPSLVGNRHLQSLMSQAPWRRRRVLTGARELLRSSRQVVLDCGDGIRLQGSFSGPGERGTVVLLHGWEGSADSPYVLSAGSRLLRQGYGVFRLNLRDHGDTKALNEQLFHSCRIDEVVAAVGRVREMARPRFFAVVGQSLGGNFALRVAARSADAGLALDRVIAVCPVLEPAHTMRALDEGLWIYRHYFLRRWRHSLAEKAKAFPKLYRFGDLRRFDTLTDMTRFFVEHYTEFADLDAYLTGYAITGQKLSTLAVPSRIIAAEDDPVIPSADLRNLSTDGTLDVTVVRNGGHCGFVDDPFGPTWIDREIVADLARFDQAADEL